MSTSLIKDEDDDDECNDMIIKRSVSWTRRKDRWACPLSYSPLLGPFLLLAWWWSWWSWRSRSCWWWWWLWQGDLRRILFWNILILFLGISTIPGSSPWRARFCDESIILQRQIPISEIPRVDALGTRLSLSIHLNRHLIVVRILEHTWNLPFFYTGHRHILSQKYQKRWPGLHIA